MLEKSLTTVRHAVADANDLARSTYRRAAKLVKDLDRSQMIVLYIEYPDRTSMTFRFGELIDTRYAFHWDDPTAHTRLLGLFGRLEQRLRQLGCESISPQLSSKAPLKPWNTVELHFPDTFDRHDKVIEAVENFALQIFERTRIDTRAW